MSASGQPIVNSNQRDAIAEALLGKRVLLYSIFHPRTVAVIGASGQPETFGYKTFSSLMSSPFGGDLFAVNSEETAVLGVQAYPSISAVQKRVDLAVVATPAETVPWIIDECAQAGVKGAIVLSAGFSERGREGAALEQQIQEKLDGSRMRLVGPSSLGVINPLTGLNATPGLRVPLGGSVAFLSQSGALATAILDWSLQQIVGFSAFVSVGTMLDVGWGDLIDYFGSDPQTRSILIYMESINDVGSFLSAAREVSRDKPIIVIKAGRTDDAVRAVPWHTAHVAGDDAVLEAAFRRVGVLRVESIDELFFMADVLSKQPLPNGPRLMVVSNAGAPSMLAADSVISTGGELAQLSSEGRAEFDKLRPVVESDNPIDVLGDGSPETYAKAIEISAKDPNCDGLLLLTLPTTFSDPRKATDLLLAPSNRAAKPILACFMGGETAAAQENLTRACIPTLPSPRAAARAFHYMWQYSCNLRGIYETPMFHSDLTDVTLRQLAESVIHAGRDSGRTLLTDVEAKRVLAAYRIPTLETRLARSEGEALRVASEIGFPAVLKPVPDPASQEIEFEGMPLTVLDAEAVRRAWKLIESALGKNGGAETSFAVSLQPAVRLDSYELSLGSRLDPQFGPVLRFGLGGKLADVFRDRSFGLPPLNATLARRMRERSKIYTALQSAGAVDLAALDALLVRFSQLVVEQAWIKEIEINPLLTSPQLLALDARVVVHGQEVDESKLPRPVIRPYPMQYVSTWRMKDGQAVIFRPIRAEDEPLMVKFHQGLSDRSVYLRYFQGVGLNKRTAHDPLTRICFIDYDREMALVGEQRDPQTEERRIIALGNLTKAHGRNEAELAAMISDNCQGRGLGVEMMRRLIRVARDERLDRVLATTMTENYGMSAIFKRLGFETSINLEDGVIEAEMRL